MTHRNENRKKILKKPTTGSHGSSPHFKHNIEALHHRVFILHIHLGHVQTGAHVYVPERGFHCSHGSPTLVLLAQNLLHHLSVSSLPQVAVITHDNNGEQNETTDETHICQHGVV